jgi:hypothetical protein
MVYWPAQETQGYLDEYHLLMIAAYLYQENKDWDREIEKYMEENP